MAILARPLFTNIAEPNTQELHDRLRWVIGLRWTVVIALFIVAVVGLLRSNASGDSADLALIQVGLALLVALINGAVLYTTRKSGPLEGRIPNIVRYGLVPVDIVLFTILLHLSGGITSPVFVLYFLYVFIGLATLPPSGAYWVALGAAVCYAGLARLEAIGLTPPSGTIGSSTQAQPVSASVYVAYIVAVSATLLITAYVANYFAALLTKDERTIRQQLDEMNTLYSLANKMSTVLTSDDVVNNLLSTVVEISSADAASILLFDDRGVGKFAALHGYTAEEQQSRMHATIEADNPLIKQIVPEKGGLYAPDIDTVSDLRSQLVRKATHSFYALPLLNNGNALGLVNMSFDRRRVLPEPQWRLLQAVTQQASLALERSRLFSDAERAAREMTGLYHIGLATTSSLQIEEVLRLIYEQVNRVLHPDTFYIGLYDDDLGEIRFDIFVENGEFLPPFRTRLLGGICAYVIRNRRPVFVSKWSSEIEQLPFEAGIVGAPTKSVISVPLTAKNKMVGVMSVQALEPYAFDQDHLRLLTSIAGQAALALENAKLHAQVFEQAQRDPLTGVFNHGTFIDKLQGRVRKSVTLKQNLALIMLDIDRFKQYNDTYGHMVGDDVLRSIVVSIQNHLKSTDVVGRWGGEEFGLVLPDVTRAQAHLVAERIRQTAMNSTLKDLHNRSIPSPTVSQGIALYPDDATNVEELIDKANSALYRAKDPAATRLPNGSTSKPTTPSPSAPEASPRHVIGRLTIAPKLVPKTCPLFPPQMDYVYEKHFYRPLLLPLG